MATYNVAIQFFIIVDPQGVNMLKHVLNTESENIIGTLFYTYKGKQLLATDSKVCPIYSCLQIVCELQ